jgi:curli biogenesis system outer membrane secretion channel CsgG
MRVNQKRVCMMRKQMFHGMIFSLLISFSIIAIIAGGCAIVRDAPQPDTSYQPAEYEGQISYRTIQELDQIFPQGFWRETQLQIPQQDRVKIAVKEFSNTTAQQDLGKMIAEIFTTAFVKSEAFIFVERQQLEKVIHEFELNQSGMIDESTSKEIGHVLGVDAILTGSISQIGNDQRVDARVIDISTGVVVVDEKMESAISVQSVGFMARRVTRRMIDKYYK